MKHHLLETTASTLQTPMVTSGQRQPLHTALAERTRQAYNASPLTQAQVGAIAGLSAMMLSNIGRTMPAVNTIEKLAHGLGVAPCWLAFGTHGRRVFRKNMGPEEPMQQGPATAPPDP